MEKVMAKIQGEKAKRNQWQNLMNFNAGKNKKLLGDVEVHTSTNVHKDVPGGNDSKVTNSSVK